MIEDYQARGDWWIAGEKGNKVSGILYYDPEKGSRLELFDTFGDPSDFDHPDEIEPVDRILGLSADNEHITLLNCGKNWPQRGGGRTPTGQRQYKLDRYYPEYILVGDYFDDTVIFDAVDFQFPHLEEWAQVEVIEAFEEDDGSRGVRYSPVRSQAAVIDDFAIILGFYVSESYGQWEANFEQVTELNVVSDSGLELSNVMDTVLPNLRNLLAIASGEPIGPTEVTGILANVDEYGLDRKIDILYSSHDSRINLGNEFITFSFSFSDIQDRIDTILEKWFSEAERLEPLYDLYFGTIYNEMSARNKFLNLTQALEAYHRRSFDDKYVSINEYFEYYCELYESIPEDYPKSFKDKLAKGVFRFANEYSLNRRLKDLFSEYENILLSVIDFGEFDIYDDIVTIRNDLTHYDQDEPGELPEDQTLESRSPILLMLVEICILSETGFPEDLIKERVPGQHTRKIDPNFLIEE